MKLSQLLSEHSVVGVAGNKSTGKTLTVLRKLLDLRAEYPQIPIYVMGIEESLRSLLFKHNIYFLESEMDILDLQLKSCVIFIDEIATIFDTATKSKQLDKLERFFDRLAHNNVKLIVGTTREGYWNKFACARITAFIVKEMEYSALVNGTWLKERVCAVRSLNDYRLECPVDYFYVVTNRFGLCHKYPSVYDEQLDTKKHNENLFKKNDKKGEHKNEK